ncbi:hypothetical protein GA0061078_0999 [Bifidobacterium bohemicum]|uniref:Uncharacterized protein n=1 Tax=Bifidobacterium bohemicum DSM 22767 TaxID=1437606 RepID=A0A086ZEA5_9BIFI|nr:hypothetical protein [Bifidobacterium bohemicum]KFI44855.1 hypothetical protein BBOH_1586 [Bifidobacterium bohemicum DSM 22767]SCB95609.1 hypothetical protein GA0061078_0999 [Bifidobacterium bohemicum]
MTFIASPPRHDKTHKAGATPNTGETQPHENPAPDTAQPEQPAKSTEPTAISPQLITCSQPGEHLWPETGGTDPLHWKEESVGNDCVLTLTTGTVPDYGGTDDATGVP